MRILWLILFLLPVQLMAQVEVWHTMDVGPSFKLDTAWCRKNTIDCLKVNFYDSRNDKGDLKSKPSYVTTVLLSKGVPTRIATSDGKEEIADTFTLPVAAKFIIDTNCTETAGDNWKRTLCHYGKSFKYELEYGKGRLDSAIHVNGWTDSKDSVIVNKWKVTYSYRPDGKLLQVFDYNGNGFKSGITTYNYSSEGQLLSYTECFNYYKDASCSLTAITYYSNGQIVLKPEK